MKQGQRGGVPRLESKHDLRNMCLPVIIDDLSQGELTKEYGFTSDHHIDAKRNTEADYYIQKLTEILGPLPPVQEPIAGHPLSPSP